MSRLHLLAQVTDADLLLFGLLLLLVFFALFGMFWFSWRMSSKDKAVSPYSCLPVRRGTTLSYWTVEKVLRYLLAMKQYDNRMFDLRKAAVCRETGRIFPNCVTWYDSLDLDWGFIQKRYPGKYVSWGSLTPEQKQQIREMHESLDGFQTDFSSKEPMPRAVEPKYALTKPGPLYVDVETKVLLGWKEVPDTELEVLIVQKPKPQNYYYHV